MCLCEPKAQLQISLLATLARLLQPRFRALDQPPFTSNEPSSLLENSLIITMACKYHKIPYDRVTVPLPTTLPTFSRSTGYPSNSTKDEPSLEKPLCAITAGLHRSWAQSSIDEYSPRQAR